jgi:hypothetical protein
LARPRPYGKLEVKGTAAALNTYQSLSTKKILSENLKGRDDLGDIGIDRWIILTLISQKTGCEDLGWIQLAITALPPAHMNIFVQILPFFPLCTQIKNSGYIRATPWFAKLDPNGKWQILEIHSCQNHGWWGTAASAKWITLAIIWLLF